jgi:hypothetical protein
MPPPIFIGYNSPQFDFTSKHHIEFTDEGECVIDGFCTGDIFDLANRKFLKRKITANETTWKNNF